MTILTFIDTETTGLEAGSRMVEVAAIKTDEAGETMASFTALVNPGMPVPPDVEKIHGITSAMLASARSVAPVLMDLLAFLQGSDFLVAHNAPYDVGILGCDLGRAGLNPAMPPVVDTCALAKFLRATPNNRLVTLVQHYGLVPTGDAHRAACDADACRQYWQKVKPKSAASMAAPWLVPHFHVEPEAGSFLAKVAAHVAQGAPLEFDYTDAKGARTHRRLIPYGWAQVGQAVQFHGLDVDKQERRTFLVDRVAVAA